LNKLYMNQKDNHQLIKKIWILFKYLLIDRY